MRMMFWNASVGLKRGIGMQRGQRRAAAASSLIAAGLIVLALSPANANLCQLSAENGGVVACLRIQAPNSSEFWILAQEYKGLEYVTELRINFHSQDEVKRLLNYQSTDHLLSLSPLSPTNGLLLTIWEGGSHVGIRIFRLAPEKATLVFDRQVEYLPEVLWDAILLNRGKVVRDGHIFPEVTEIYRWEESLGRYQLQEIVPWSERYRTLAKMNHAAPAPNSP